MDDKTTITADRTLGEALEAAVAAMENRPHGWVRTVGDAVATEAKRIADYLWREAVYDSLRLTDVSVDEGARIAALLFAEDHTIEVKPNTISTALLADSVLTAPQREAVQARLDASMLYDRETTYGDLADGILESLSDQAAQVGGDIIPTSHLAMLVKSAVQSVASWLWVNLLPLYKAHPDARVSLVHEALQLSFTVETTIKAPGAAPCPRFIDAAELVAKLELISRERLDGETSMVLGDDTFDDEAWTSVYEVPPGEYVK